MIAVDGFDVNPDQYHSLEHWLGLTWENGTPKGMVDNVLDNLSVIASHFGKVNSDWSQPALEFNDRDDRVSWYDSSNNTIYLSDHGWFPFDEPDQNYISCSQLLHEFVHSIVGTGEPEPHGSRFISHHFEWLVITGRYPDWRSIRSQYLEWTRISGIELPVPLKYKS